MAVDKQYIRDEAIRIAAAAERQLEELYADVDDEYYDDEEFYSTIQWMIDCLHEFPMELGL